MVQIVLFALAADSVVAVGSPVVMSQCCPRKKKETKRKNPSVNRRNKGACIRTKQNKKTIKAINITLMMKIKTDLKQRENMQHALYC